MQPRLTRYKNFINNEFIHGLMWHKDYSIKNVAPKLIRLARGGTYQRVIFIGMGYSAAIAQVLKSFFAYTQTPIHIEVVSDYELEYLIEPAALKKNDTLIIISSYSGNSPEPIRAYERLKSRTKNIIFLTSGGKLKKIAKTENVSYVEWKLRNPDNVYPLFHTPQCFAILLDMFSSIGLIHSNYQIELRQTAENLKNKFTNENIKSAEHIANRLKNRQLVLIAPRKWHIALSKLATMHFNEIAMVPAYRESIHEFTHGVIAALTDSSIKHSIIIFHDKRENPHVLEKIETMQSLFIEPIIQNRNIELVTIPMKGKNFFEKFFSTLLFIQHVVLHLGTLHNISSRLLVSRTVKNPWYKK